MPIEVVFAREALFTLTAWKGLLFGVSLHVVIKVAFLIKTFSTHLTSEGSLHVSSDVDIEAVILRETLSALLARVRLLSGVNPHVPFKAVHLSETVSAQLTGEVLLSAVNRHVLLKVSF